MHKPKAMVLNPAMCRGFVVLKIRTGILHVYSMMCVDETTIDISTNHKIG